MGQSTSSSAHPPTTPCTAAGGAGSSPGNTTTTTTTTTAAAAAAGGASSTSSQQWDSSHSSQLGNQLRENLESLHHQLMQHAGADFDIATTTTLSYTQFLAYITQLNAICRQYQDGEGRVLVFAVKKGTDSSIFWKATVRIACVKYHTGTERTESHRLLNIRQFLQVFRRITYECTAGSLGAAPPAAAAAAADGRSSHAGMMPPTTAASVVLEEMTGGRPRHAASAAGGASSKCPPEELEECVICLERQPEVILPCAHAYCLPCIQQWWEYSSETPRWRQQCNDHHLFSVLPAAGGRDEEEHTCPVCREAVADTEDTWVISEAPDDDLVTSEISKALMGLAEGSSSSSRGGGHLSVRKTSN